MMTASTATKPFIRKVNVRHDLLAVADLIEVCFASTLDDDGRMYLNHLRWAARDFNYLSWLQGAAERLASPLYGFVWEEHGRIVGNLSLIPFYRQGQVYYLIANVAVHPDYRRRGIARQLTQAAIDHLRERHFSSAWLQVREDNPAAYHLYRSLGFQDRARRTHWLASTAPPPVSAQPPAHVSVGPRRSADWPLQRALLKQAYPPEVSWNLAINLNNLSPSLLQKVFRLLNGDTMRHWAAYLGNEPVGFITWEPSRTSSDMLWLAAIRDEENPAAHALLTQARAQLYPRRRPLLVNYPAGWAVDAFTQAGFTTQYTLVWMSLDL